MPATMDKLPAQHVDRVIPGFTRLDLARKFAEEGFAKGAEIGVADGRYSLALCQAIPGLKLLCVDPWKKYEGNPRGGPQTQHDGNYALATQRLRPYDAVLIRQMSVEASKLVPDGSLDFVYIDGNHEYEYVLADLWAWVPKVRIGGTVAGHDCYHFGNDGVVRAVEEYTTVNRIDDWSICDERERSFFWRQR